MVVRDLFWFVAGLMAAVAGVLIAIPLLRARAGEARASSRGAFVVAAAAFGSVAVSIVGLYLWLGTPAALESRTAAQAEAPTAASSPAEAGQTSLSMEQATARLAARLQAGGGTRDEWRLLAQSYEFLGRSEEAAAARKQGEAAPAGSAGAAAGAAGDTPAASAPKTVSPDDQRELAKADELRRQRDFKGAVAIYAALAGRGALTADGWADYADSLATVRDTGLAGEPARFIEEALKLDPRHPKALWLKASLAYQEKRYADAVAGWTELGRALPADSPDQPVIAANLAESARLGGLPLPAAAPAETPGTAAGTARIEGVVELAPGLRGRDSAGATLYIYARQIGAAGPPLAVLRVPAGEWPFRFVLDDSNAMVPGRNLSSVETVQLEARVSKSGNATPQSGDLAGTLPSINPKAGKPVRIAIDRVIS